MFHFSFELTSYLPLVVHITIKTSTRKPPSIILQLVYRGGQMLLAEETGLSGSDVITVKHQLF
jgi:hypothetical protein